MSKYIDYNGLFYFFNKLKTKFSLVGHTHPASELGIDGISNTDIDDALNDSRTTSIDNPPNTTDLSLYYRVDGTWASPSGKAMTNAEIDEVCV